jgi:hypothetical protein
MLPTNPFDDDDQASLAVQRDVRAALRLAFKAATAEPLPEQMAVLLLRVALAESLSITVEVDASECESSAAKVASA